MILWIVWSGDGYGHNSMELLTGDEERAKREVSDRGWVESVTVEDIGKGIEAALTKLSSRNYY